MPDMRANVELRKNVMTLFLCLTIDKIFFDILHADLRVFGFMTNDLARRAMHEGGVEQLTAMCLAVRNAGCLNFNVVKDKMTSELKSTNINGWHIKHFKHSLPTILAKSTTNPLFHKYWLAWNKVSAFLNEKDSAAAHKSVTEVDDQGKCAMKVVTFIFT